MYISQMPEEIYFKCPIEVGYTYEETIKINEREISEFASLSGDSNPIHHNKDIAAQSRFGGIIASGPQTSAIYMSTHAACVSPDYLAIGMKFDCEFAEPVRPDIELLIKWVAKTIVPKPRLKGYIVTTEGGMYHEGNTLLSSHGTFLITKN